MGYLKKKTFHASNDLLEFLLTDNGRNSIFLLEEIQADAFLNNQPSPEFVDLIFVFALDCKKS